MNNWILREDEFDVEKNLAYEGLFTQGSGYLHLRGSLEEHLSETPQNLTYMRSAGNVTVEVFKKLKAKWGTFIPGIYGKHPVFVSQLINLPWFAGISIEVDGTTLDMEKCTITNYSRILNLKSGELTRTFEWKTANGTNLKISFARFISSTRKKLCCQKVNIIADKSCSLKISGGIDADVRTSGHDHFSSVAIELKNMNSVKCTVKSDIGDTVNILTQFSGVDAKWNYIAGEKKGELVSNFTLAPGKEISIEKRTALTTSRDLEKEDEAAILNSAAPLTYSALLNESAQEWEKRWNCSDVQVDGDDNGQIALRASIYHLLRCHVPGDNRVTIDAKGYAGDAYFGHFFWDTEMYLLPFYLYTDPERAKTFTDFRIHALPAAMKYAEKMGYRGARFPWESDSNGDECCARGNWQYGDHEIHITGDVAYGIAHYAAALGNDGYLEKEAATLLVESARYWLDRIDWREGDGYPSILGVMGPDEYTPISHNNSYTNRMAALNLSLAAKFGKKGGATEKECAEFDQAAKLLPLPRISKTLVAQCEDFEKLADPQFDKLWKNRKKAFAAQVSQERLYRTRCSKQADVLMLMVLFPNEFTKDELQAAWDYYVPYCTHDSSLSPGAHALTALKLGLLDEAWKFWEATGGLDLDIDHGGAEQGIHIANCGSTWMVAVNGFGGLKSAMDTDILTLNPVLPDKWTKLSFPLIWKGTKVKVDITKDAVSITNIDNNAITTEVCGILKNIQPSSTVIFTNG